MIANQGGKIIGLGLGWADVFNASLPFFYLGLSLVVLFGLGFFFPKKTKKNI